MTATLRRRTRDVFVWVITIPVLLAIINFWAARRYRESISWVAHTRDVMLAIDDLRMSILSAESSQRGYLITADERYELAYESARDQLPAEISRLRQLTWDNPRQQGNLDRLSSAIRKRVTMMDQVLAVRFAGQFPNSAALEAIRAGMAMMAEIRDICVEMAAEEGRLLVERKQVQQRTETEVAVCFALGVLVSVSLLYWAYELIRHYAKRRDDAEMKLREFNANLEFQVQERTSELLAANERLSRSNEDLTRFAYIASHDLQEPIRTMGSYAGLLARRYEGRLDPQADKYIGHIVEGAKRMRALVNDLLAYSRTGTQALQVEPINMEAVLARVKEDLRASIVDHRPLITHDPLPCLNADADKLVRVLQNLVANAIKFRKPEQDLAIHIGAEHRADEWVFSVRDNGIGFEPRHAQRIFIIFQRLHQVGAFPGTGIGLAICKRIVEAHGGRIWAESQPGVGSTFFFTIAAHKAQTNEPLHTSAAG